MGRVNFLLLRLTMYINHTSGQAPFPGVVDQRKQDSIFVGQRLWLRERENMKLGRSEKSWEEGKL